MMPIDTDPTTRYRPPRPELPAPLAHQIGPWLCGLLEGSHFLHLDDQTKDNFAQINQVLKDNPMIAVGFHSEMWDAPLYATALMAHLSHLNRVIAPATVKQMRNPLILGLAYLHSFVLRSNMLPVVRTEQNRDYPHRPLWIQALSLIAPEFAFSLYQLWQQKLLANYIYHSNHALSSPGGVLANAPQSTRSQTLFNLLQPNNGINASFVKANPDGAIPYAFFVLKRSPHHPTLRLLTCSPPIFPQDIPFWDLNQPEQTAYELALTYLYPQILAPTHVEIPTG